ncbi:MAG: hypothetical protein KF802_12495 [Bdellovibrionaceae bacterium]|nr:hypothetical protein [Pseudobdellovibrionaceae bacterium]
MRSLVALAAWMWTLSALAGPQIGFWEQEGARVVFEKNKKGWSSRQIRVFTPANLATLSLKFERPDQWHAFFEGRSYGPVQTAVFPRYEFYAQSGLQKITRAPPAPFRTESEEFATGIKTKNLRPVLLTDQPVKDPEVWSKSAAAPKALKKAKDKFILLFGRGLDFAKDSEFQNKDPKRRLRAEDLRLQTVYRSRRGDELFSLAARFQDSFVRCSRTGVDCPIESKQWFLARQGQVTSLGDAVALIAAADADRDGKSEFFFFLNRNDQIGYALVPPNGKRLEFLWTDH